MNLAVRMATVVIIILVLVAVAYLGVGLVILRELKYARGKCQKHTKELGQLRLAHEGIVQAIAVIEENIAKHGADAFQERKLADMQKSLEKNERKTKEAQEQLEKYQSEVTHGEESLQKWKRFTWLRGH